jgi:hypothetical protein
LKPARVAEGRIGRNVTDLTCSHWAGMGDKELELYFFYRP